MTRTETARTIIWEFPMRVFKSVQDKLLALKAQREREEEARWFNG